MDFKDVGQDIIENVVRQGTGLISSRPNARFVTGARTILKVNNQLFGFAFSVSWRITTDVIDITTIDDYLPYEFAPRRISVEGTLSSFRIPGRGPTAEVMQASVLSFPFHKYISIEVRDSVSNALLFYTDKAVITTRAEDISNENLTSVSINWKAIGWKDDNGEENLPVNANATFKDREVVGGGLIRTAVNAVNGANDAILNVLK